MSWAPQQPSSGQPQSPVMVLSRLEKQTKAGGRPSHCRGRNKSQEQILSYTRWESVMVVLWISICWDAEAVWILHSLEVNMSGVQPVLSSLLDQSGWSPGSLAPQWCERASAPAADLWEAETSTTWGCWAPPQSLASCSKHRCVPWCFEGWGKKRRVNT